MRLLRGEHVLKETADSPRKYLFVLHSVFFKRPNEEHLLFLFLPRYIKKREGNPTKVEKKPITNILHYSFKCGLLASLPTQTCKTYSRVLCHVQLVILLPPSAGDTKGLGRTLNISMKVMNCAGFCFSSLVSE